MSIHVTFKCDGIRPPGSKERCRGGIAVAARIWDTDLGDVIYALDPWDVARAAGWTEETAPHQHYCPACTRYRTTHPA